MFLNTQLRMVLIGLALPTIVFAATPTVSNVTAKQRYPWNGSEDSFYTLLVSVATQKPKMLSASPEDRVNDIKCLRFVTCTRIAVRQKR